MKKIFIISFGIPLIVILIFFVVLKDEPVNTTQDSQEKIISAKKRVDTMPSYNNLIWLGLAYFHAGVYKQAIPVFERSIQVDPKRFEAYQNLCVIADIEKKWNDSLKYCSKSLEINPGNQKAIEKLNRAKENLK